MRAALVRKGGQERTEIRDDVATRELGPGDVRVRIRASGVCHSDLSAMAGVLPNKKPFVLGHEGAGEIAEIGEQVPGLAVGDQVHDLTGYRVTPHIAMVPGRLSR